MEARDAAKCPTVHRTASHDKKLSSSNVSSAKAGVFAVRDNYKDSQKSSEIDERGVRKI